MESEASIIEGAGSQTGGLDRWGDYSALRIDPADDCTFWYTTQYLATNGSFNWRTRIGSFKFTSCGAAGGDAHVHSAGGNLQRDAERDHQHDHLGSLDPLHHRREHADFLGRHRVQRARFR